MAQSDCVGQEAGQGQGLRGPLPPRVLSGSKNRVEKCQKNEYAQKSGNESSRKRVVSCAEHCEEAELEKDQGPQQSGLWWP